MKHWWIDKITGKGIALLALMVWILASIADYIRRQYPNYNPRSFWFYELPSNIVGVLLLIALLVGALHSVRPKPGVKTDGQMSSSRPPLKESWRSRISGTRIALLAVTLWILGSILLSVLRSAGALASETLLWLASLPITIAQLLLVVALAAWLSKGFSYRKKK